jgi:hypothetical protein
MFCDPSEISFAFCAQHFVWSLKMMPSEMVIREKRRSCITVNPPSFSGLTVIVPCQPTFIRDPAVLILLLIIITIIIITIIIIIRFDLIFLRL